MKRVITEREAELLKFIRQYEAILELKDRFTFLIQLTEEGMFTAYMGEESRFYRILSLVEGKDPAGGKAYFVRMWMHDFEAYLHYILQNSGMAYLPNYKLVLQDGYTIQI